MENHPSSWENQLYIAIFNNKLLTSPRRPQATAPGSLLTISKSLGRNPKTFHQFHRSYAPCKTCSKHVPNHQPENHDSQGWLWGCSTQRPLGPPVLQMRPTRKMRSKRTARVVLWTSERVRELKLWYDPGISWDILSESIVNWNYHSYQYQIIISLVISILRELGMVNPLVYSRYH